MNLLRTNQSLNKGKTFYVDYKISKNGTTIRVFSSFFVNFSEKYVSIKSVFKVWNDQLSYFKIELLQKLQEWWTEDVDGDCISFNLYRNSENSIVLLKRYKGDFRKEEYCQTYQQGFLYRRVNSNWVVYQKKQWKSLWNKNWRKRTSFWLLFWVWYKCKI